MKPVVYPYKIKSESAKEIANALGCVRVFPNNNFRNNFKRPIINWGNSETPVWWNRWPNQVVLNHYEAVKIAANKLLSFQKFKEQDVKHPKWTTKKEDIVFTEDCFWVARKSLTGKAGEGIVLIHSPEGIISAPLYTKYFKKKYEYRVHVIGNNVVDFAMKKAREGVIPDSYQIRNSSNGWIFCREGVELPPQVSEESIKAVAALGLTFGAVDVGWNEKKQEACVFEVNTAPGIQGTTINSYVKAFQEILK